MKVSYIRTIGYNLFIIGFLILVTACNSGDSKEKTIEVKTETEEIKKFDNIYWNVKVIQPDGKSLAVKAFDNMGKSFDIKAVQNSNQDNLLDVKAVLGDVKLPVKMLVNKNQFAPVAAISNDGKTYKLKAISADGELDVIGVARFGNVVIMKALNNKGKFYGVKAISPTGQMNDVKGIKINYQDREMTLKGQSVYAHVKAMHPSDNEDKFKMPKKNKKKPKIYKSGFERVIWNIKAVTPEGKNLAIKAFDKEGNRFDVKATQDSEQHSFLNIKAFVNKDELPVKILESPEGEEFAPIKAIGRDGTIFDIKALSENNVKLDVKGISRSGIIIHVKAINENNEFYAVKAFAPDGKLNQVKGIKIFDRTVEMNLRGNSVYAHLKAIK